MVCKDIMLIPSVMNIRQLVQRLWETDTMQKLEIHTNTRLITRFY